jgi:hypothetical protein
MTGGQFGQRPDDDPLVTTLDGRMLDVTIDVQAETVTLTGWALGEVTLTPAGAIEYAQQIAAAARALQEGDIGTL